MLLVLDLRHPPRAAQDRRQAGLRAGQGDVGFRRFQLRGRELSGAEWLLISLMHNILKLFRSGAWPLPA